jgi:hypothetical protein
VTCSTTDPQLSPQALSRTLRSWVAIWLRRLKTGVQNLTELGKEIQLDPARNSSDFPERSAPASTPNSPQVLTRDLLLRRWSCRTSNAIHASAAGVLPSSRADPAWSLVHQFEVLEFRRSGPATIGVMREIRWNVRSVWHGLP